MSETPTTALAPLDLDADRKRRAAEREGKQMDQPIIIGGEVIAVLPVELPIDVLAPIRGMDDDIALLLREMVKGMQSGDGRADATGLFVDLIAANPKLPTNLLDTIQQITRNLFGNEGYEALVKARLTREDLGYLAKGVMEFYGLSLGESLPSSDSPTDDGTTSSSTSSGTSPSTPDESGEVEAEVETPALAPTPTT